MAPAKILIVGATGYLGKNIANASVKLGHPTFVLVRSTTSDDPAKQAQLDSLKAGGVTFLKGDLNDHDSLVSALRQVEVVISVVGGFNTLDQLKIIDAAKETGTIKRFFPSEFGNDVDRLELDVEVTKGLWQPKLTVRRAVEASGIPYTFVASGSFAGYYLGTLAQDGTWTPPRDKVLIWGDGNAKVIFTDEVDIGTFTIKAADDPRTENKSLHIRAKENFASQNEIVALWEKKIGKTLEKEFVSAEALLKLIEESPLPANLFHAIRYSIFVKGDQTSFDLGPNDVEATELYPDVKYTTISEYLNRFV